MPYHMGWGNPLHELIGKENKTCKGCQFQSTEKAFGMVINFCAKGKKNLKRCKQYQEREIHAIKPQDKPRD